MGVILLQLDYAILFGVYMTGEEEKKEEYYKGKEIKGKLDKNKEYYKGEEVKGEKQRLIYSKEAFVCSSGSFKRKKMGYRRPVVNRVKSLDFIWIYWNADY